MNLALQRLRAEVTSDVGVFESRLDELAALPALAGSPGALAQAAVALHHAYGAIESALLRVARAFEGATDGPDWHQALLTSMGLEIEAIRPAILSPTTLDALRRLLGFRHFFRHAYGVPFDPARVEAVRAAALTARTAIRDDFRRLDDLLRDLADAS